MKTVRMKYPRGNHVNLKRSLKKKTAVVIIVALHNATVVLFQSMCP
jgi:hypothetical protein